MKFFLKNLNNEKINKLKKVFLLKNKNPKNVLVIFFGLFVVGLLFLFFQNFDRFSSVDAELEEIDMTNLPLYVEHEVPFTSQAPSRQWQDSLYQDACEETSIIIATHWIYGEKDDISVGKAEMELENLFEIVKEKHETAIDMSAEDTTDLLREYSKSDKIELVYDMNLEDVLQSLADGNILIVPADGEWLDNKYFVGTGPERHMTVVIGYDYKKKEFITNDPGTNKGKGFRYSFDNLMSSIRNYKTGEKVPIDDEEERRVMIVVGR